LGPRTSNSDRDKYLAYYFQSGVLKVSIIKLNSRSMDLMYSVEKYTKFLAQTSDLLSDKRFELTPKKEWLAYPPPGAIDWCNLGRTVRTSHWKTRLMSSFN